MKKLSWLLLLLMLGAAFMSCEKDDDDNDNNNTPVMDGEFLALVSLLEGQDGGYLNTDAPRVVAASVVHDALDEYTVLDVRTGDKYGPGTPNPNGVVDFEDGHIPGAHMVALADVVNWVEENGLDEGSDKYLVVCYTGQSAGHAVLALNLLGYEAYSLGWGMSGWHSDFDFWSSHTSNDFVDDFTTDPDPGKAAQGDSPDLDDVDLNARVQAMLDAGFKGVSAAEVVDNPDEYYVVNYFTEAQYLGEEGCPPGHLAGAHQYTPKVSLQSGEDLYTLPADKKIALYCWTGQHGSQAVAYLNILGYDAYDIKFGVNGMVHDQLTAHKWDATTIPDYAYETGTGEGPTEFDVLVEYLETTDYINDMPGWIVNWADIQDNLADYFIMDFRSAADFENPGHLDGAVNVTLGTMFQVNTDQNTEAKPVLCVCYTGQTASYAHTLLELKGIDAVVLKFGMSIVGEEYDHWTDNCSNEFADDPNWVTTDPPELPTHDWPVIDTGFTTPEEILDARIDAAIAAWPVMILAADVMADPSAYNIINYWPQSDWDNYGHIAGAYQVTPKTIQSNANLSVFDPDAENVIYCYTGQTGAAVSAYLKVLNYDIKDIKFGANAMIWDEMESHKWPKPWGGD